MRVSTPESSWQKILAEGFTSATDLLKFLHIPVESGSHIAEVQFKTRVPRGFAALMQPGNRYDPLLLQVLAVAQELSLTTEFEQDPLKESKTNILPGLIHKYHGRVLFMMSGACAIHCRYCFRRHFPYEDNTPGMQGWQPALDYIAHDTSIHEVILSGGDPLLVRDNMLAAFLEKITAIPHVHTLRLHTRVPVVLPERIDASFLQLFQANRLQKVMVLHANHPRELDSRVQAACVKLRSAGFLLLNQSVLLAGVNDDASTLIALSQRLCSCGVLPYYLHLLDKVQGAAHFAVPLDVAGKLFKQLQEQLPGYLVPRLAREDAGQKCKTLVLPKQIS